MRRWPRPALIALAAFLTSAALTVLIDHPAALALGVLLLMAVLPLGLFAIATPAYLADAGADGELKRDPNDTPAGRA